MTVIDKHGESGFTPIFNPEDGSMHYHYFTLEQRHALERTIRQRLTEPGMDAVLQTLRTPEFGVCESCGTDIPYVKLIGNPALRRCPDCFKR